MLCPKKRICPPCIGLKLMRSSVLELKLSRVHELYLNARGGHISFLGQNVSRLSNKARQMRYHMPIHPLNYSTKMFEKKLPSH